jgi:hypothetical protein
MLNRRARQQKNVCVYRRKRQTIRATELKEIRGATAWGDYLKPWRAALK